MEDKQAIYSYYNSNKLLNQRSEILNIYRHKMFGYMIGKIYIFLLFLALFFMLIFNTFWRPFNQLNEIDSTLSSWNLS